MTTTETVTARPGSTSPSHGTIRAFPVGTNCPRSERHGVPLTIDRDQLYYWSALWRDGVREAEDALANGDIDIFDSDDPNDVIHWLFEVDEDD